MAMAGTPAAMVVGAYAETVGCTFTATMSGDQEAPTPTKATYKGTAKVTISLPANGLGTVCFEISVTGITLPAAAAHIHKGASGVAGPVVVPFTPPDASGKVSGCTTNVDPVLTTQIMQNPAGYYVNVHNKDFPGGVIRGQLVPSAASGS